MADKVVVTGTEQAPPSPAPSAPVTETTKPSEFSNLHEALEQASVDFAKAPEVPAKAEEESTGKEETTPLGKEEPSKEFGKKDEKAAAKEPSKTPFYITDEKGNKTPLVIKADGKEFVPDSIEKVMTWASLGIHANTRLEELKAREEQLGKFEGMLREIEGAIASGNVEIKGGKLIAKPRRTGEAPEESGEPKQPEDDVFESPEAKEIKTLKTKLAKMEKDVIGMSSTFMDKYVKEQKDILDRDIETQRPKYFLARDKDIWDLLAEVDGNQPRYNAETAMKSLHEQELGRLTASRKDHPEIIDKQEIITEYLKEKSAKEAAPVQGPSDKSTPSPPANKKREFKDQHEALEAFAEDLKAGLFAKTKF